MLVDSYRLPGGLRIDERRVRVPVDHFGAQAAAGLPGRLAAVGEIDVAARIVSTGEAAKPYLLFLQGGPGSEVPGPVAGNPSWLARALEDYSVVLLDQRGTGLSHPIGYVDGSFRGTSARGTDPVQDSGAVAAFLTHFRADAIVEDAEALRWDIGCESWSVMGQSFGGFTTLRYLAAHPESLDLAIFTGGLPRVAGSLADTPDPAELYTTTWHTLRAKSQSYFERFPADAARMRRLAERAARGKGIELPDGTQAGPAHVRGLGHLLGASGGAAALHYLLAQDIDSAAFRHDLLAALPFSARNPLYAVLQESCWANGTATTWAGVRGMPRAVATDPLWLAGEHIAPEHFATGPLRPWRPVAGELAAFSWPVMWEPDALRAAEVPVVAAVYYEDAYVPREYSLPTAGLLPRVRTWVTSEYEHNGLRASNGVVLDKLLRLARDGSLV